jgi:uncharacterized protein YjiS (DUF1127 family)
MNTQRDLHDFGTLFSTVGASASPTRERMSRSGLYDTAPGLGVRPGWRDVIRAMLNQLLVWHERTRQRRSLAELDDHLLRDLGLSRTAVTVETNKPFWRP